MTFLERRAVEVTGGDLLQPAPVRRSASGLRALRCSQRVVESSGVECSPDGDPGVLQPQENLDLPSLEKNSCYNKSV